MLPLGLLQHKPHNNMMLSLSIHGSHPISSLASLEARGSLDTTLLDMCLTQLAKFVALHLHRRCGRHALQIWKHPHKGKSSHIFS